MRKFIAAGAVAAASAGIILGGNGIASAASNPIAINTIPAGEGLYEVGYDISPGTYTTQGALNGYQNCFWARVNVGPYGVIPIAVGETQGPTTVTIESRDGAFITAGCSGWVREDDGLGSLGSAGSGSLDTGSLIGSLALGLVGSANNGPAGSLAGALLGSLLGR